jgi:hypothetical protein
VSIKLVDHKKHFIDKVLFYLYLILITALLGAMIGGRTGSGFTFYKEFGVNLYGYLLTILVILTLGYFWVKTFNSKKFIIGYLELKDDLLLIIYENEVQTFKITELQMVKIKPYYKHLSYIKDEKNRLLSFTYNRNSYRINISLNSVEEENLIRSLNGARL